METQTNDGASKSFWTEFQDCWSRLPNKALFFILLAAWGVVFHLTGNSTLGYVHSPSIFQWMLTSYESSGDSEDSFGEIVPLVVLALLWWKRKELLDVKLQLWLPGGLLLLLALGVHFLGFLIQQPRISVVAMLFGIYALVGLAWGAGMLCRSFFPMFLLGFCIPIGSLIDGITFPLRMLSCKIVVWVSMVLAIDIHQEGTRLMDSAQRYQYDIAAACSGIRSLVVTVALAVIFAFISLRPWWKRGAVILAAVPLAVAGNVFRLTTIVVTAEYFGQEQGNYVHEGGPFGIIKLLPYVPVFAGLIFLVRWLEDRPPATPKPAQKPS